MKKAFDLLYDMTKNPEEHDLMLEHMLLEEAGERKGICIISARKDITQAILEAPNLKEIVSVPDGTEIPAEMHNAPWKLKYYGHFTAKYHKPGHEPKVVDIYTNVPPVKLEFDKKYESKFSFDMPLVQEVLAATEHLAYKARAAAKGFTEHAGNRQFTYDSLPAMIKPYYERNPVIGGNLKTLRKLRGVDALNFLTQALIDRDLNEWYAGYPDYKEALQYTNVEDPNDPVFTMNPFYSMAGIARSELFELVSGQDLSREKEFFKEILYFSLLNAFLDVNQQKPEDNPWIKPTMHKICAVRDEAEKKIAGIYNSLK